MKKLLIPILVLTLSLTACKGQVKDDKIENYLPIIASSLEGGSFALLLIGEEFKDSNNWTGCVAAKATSSALYTASQVVKDPGGVFPSVSVDVQDCLNIRSESVQVPEGAELKDLILSVVTSVLSTVDYYITLQAKSDCKAAAIGKGAVQYVRGAAEPIVSEITEFDGVLEIPAVNIDFSSCQ